MAHLPKVTFAGVRCI